MPVIRPTDLSEWREQARRWQKRHPHQDALQITVEQRRLDPKARSAFYVVALARGIRAATPGFEGCCACGQPTHSWCEGCYARIQQSPSNTFSAICQQCDGESWVCDLCSLGWYNPCPRQGGIREITPKGRSHRGDGRGHGVVDVGGVRDAGTGPRPLANDCRQHRALRGRGQSPT